MAERSVRFGVIDRHGNRSSTWKCLCPSGASNEVYVICREVGHALKVSLHQSGRWHYAYSPQFFQEKVDEAHRTDQGRFIDTWARPPEIAPGTTLAVRIVIPWTAVTTPVEEGIHTEISWASRPPEGRAIEFDVVFATKDTKVTGWPGKRVMGTCLAGSLRLGSGGRLWVVHREIESPGLPPRTGFVRLYKGKTDKDLRSSSLKTLVLGVHHDGSRVLYEFPVHLGNEGA